MAAVLGYYKDITVEVRRPWAALPSVPVLDLLSPRRLGPMQYFLPSFLLPARACRQRCMCWVALFVGIMVAIAILRAPRERGRRAGLL